MDVDEGAGNGRHRGSSATSAGLGLGLPLLPGGTPHAAHGRLEAGMPGSAVELGGLGVSGYARQGMVRLRVVGGGEGEGAHGSFDWED